MIDCHENPYGFSRNDDGRVDCHESSLFNKSLDSRNDGSICIFARNDNPTLSLQANKSLENKPK
ncbi:hypothetical protein [Helicobacter sp. T3_23-1056]